MKNFVKNLLTIAIFLTGFFVFFDIPTAKACEVLPVTNLRAPSPNWFTLNNYTDNPQPYIYLDIKTVDCDTQDGNVLRVVIKNLQFSTLLSQDLEVVDIQNIKIRIKQTGSTSVQGGTVDFETTESDFSIPLRVGERGNLGSCSGVLGFDDCILFLKIFNDTVVGSPEIFNISEQGSGLTFECDYLCNTYWGLGCPIAPGQAPDTITYGSICENNNTTNNITIYGGLGSNNITSEEYSIEPLAPLPGFTGNPDFGQLLESWFTMLIVIAGILALIMIVVGGVTYITSESFGGKGQGKAYILNAVAGLVLALGAWIILNTINPNLADNLNISIPSVALTLDQQGFVDYEEEIETGQSFVLAGTFENPQTSPGLSDFLSNINSSNQIASINVSTSSSQMTITSNSGSLVVIPVTGFGANGISEPGQGVEGDRRTPKGNWQISSDIRISQNQNDAQTPRVGNFNMGPAFIGTNITTPSGKNRGIGIHGNKSNNPGPTMGCIRIKNDDVLALARKINSGVTLIID